MIGGYRYHMRSFRKFLTKSKRFGRGYKKSKTYKKHRSKSRCSKSRCSKSRCSKNRCKK